MSTMYSAASAARAASIASSDNLPAYLMEGFAFRDSIEIARERMASHEALSGEDIEDNGNNGSSEDQEDIDDNANNEDNKDNDDNVDNISVAATYQSSISFLDLNETEEDKRSDAAAEESSIGSSDPSEENFVFRNSIEIARQRLPAPVASGSSSTSPVLMPRVTFGHALTRASGDAPTTAAARPATSPAGNTRGDVEPWGYRLNHTNSFNLGNCRRIREQVSQRRAREATRGATIRALADRAKSAVKEAAGSCFKAIMPAPKAKSICGLEIRPKYNSARPMQSRDYEAFEAGPSRLRWIEQQARAEGMDPALWCRREGIRY